MCIVLFLLKEKTEMDTEPITRTNQAYLQMAQYGLFVHDLRGEYVRGHLWQCQVSMLVDIAPDIAKACVAGWLQSEYMADSITFFKRSSDKPNQFRVQFDRKDC